MSDKINPFNDGGPAFPVPYNHEAAGMSLRDWFAGQALAGLLAARRSEGTNGEWRAQMAYQQADAMLAAREEKK